MPTPVMISYTTHVRWQQRNPKRVGSCAHVRYELYKSSTTFKDARAAGMLGSDRVHDVAHTYVKEFVPPLRRVTYKRPASELQPERPSEGTGPGSSSAPGPQVNILIISMDAQRASTCTLALAQAGHVESVQVRT
jgi:hypothetical protein